MVLGIKLGVSHIKSSLTEAHPQLLGTELDDSFFLLIFHGFPWDATISFPCYWWAPMSSKADSTQSILHPTLP